MVIPCLLLCSGRGGADEVIFAVRQPKGPHWYENFGYQIAGPARTCYGARGRLCKLNLETRALTVLLDDPQGGVRDPQVHYDGQRILFSYRRGGSPHYHLYEINADGTGLKQLTDGPFDDLEPSYLPDGGIVFCSSRCQRWVPCWYVQVATLYRCDGDGRNIRPLSSNIEQDNTPWVLPDGRKKFAHEGGIASPLIVHWPVGIAKSRHGQLAREVGHLIDLMPTFLELGGATFPKTWNGGDTMPLAGVRLTPALRGEPLRRPEPLFWEHEGHRAIRDGKWKLVASFNDPWELYDLEADRVESNDLAKTQPERARALAYLCNACSTRIAAW